MRPLGVRRCVRSRRSAYTWIELVMVVVVLAVLLGIGLPALMTAIQRSRRINCTNNLKQIGLAIHNYATANRVFPPGTICSTGPVMPQNQYDVWSEAAQTTPGGHGTSFLLRILPFIAPAPPPWNFKGGVGLNAGTQAAPGSANINIREFYCPIRRMSLRSGDNTMMLASWWPGGGTDYGGCVGRHVAYDMSSPSHNVLDAGAHRCNRVRPRCHRPESELHSL